MYDNNEMGMEEQSMGSEMHPADVILSATEEILDKYLKLKIKYLAKVIEMEKEDGESEECDNLDEKILDCIEYKNKMFNLISDHVDALAPYDQGSMMDEGMDMGMEDEELLD